MVHNMFIADSLFFLIVYFYALISDLLFIILVTISRSKIQLVADFREINMTEFRTLQK